MRHANRLLAIAAAFLMWPLTATAESSDRLVLAIGEPGSDSFTFGTELWAMSQINLAPAHGIALQPKEVAADDDRLGLLRSRDVEAALVYGRVPASFAGELRSVMALWPSGLVTDEADPVQLLVRHDVTEEVVYLLTKAMFEHAGYMKSAHAKIGVGEPSEAITGLDMPLHAGAYRYYQENGFAAAGADPWKTMAPGIDAEAVQASVTFSNFDDAALSQGEIDQIAAACRQALEAGSLSAVLGDLSTTGCEVYQERLIEAADGDVTRSPSPAAFATTARTGPGGGADDDLFEAPVGQGGPAIRWVAPNKREGVGVGLLPARVGRRPVM